ncbi:MULTISPECIES: HAMP domain-containing sensor histidine kinase [unclassified Lysinibacillus]|uniref:sensor histidine kinase n=1 Tax=unclassified Lysinibacillus TaxID=2636778 RepID=UPI002010CBAF|nr:MULTISPECIES: HAMP domain-containing sensor histidine kinase [unclassified Lysinibacillus]MCL1696159.1 HAMP domain-containing histidine kinase [Lysinibacillus sp. BPa_S21]MCL1700466.1 HAMP domain-containing histidine kinase [Lysinibacillus sp. Bpr_S20]
MWFVAIVIIVGLLFYIFYLQRQLRLMNVQLSQRLHEQYTQPISVELLNKEVNQLVANINRILLESQKSRSYIKREEKYFKEMISNISHDFRTPLTAIKGYQQMLLKEPLTEKQLTKLEISQKHVGRLEQLVETFFEYSYLHSNEDQPKKNRINISNIVFEEIAGAFAQFEQQGIAVNLPKFEPLIINSDEEMLLRIVQNLVRNSIMHAQGDVTIKLWLEEEYAYICFQNPIDENIQLNPNQLFDRFYTTDNSRRKNTGLGLSIVKLLAEKLGGSATAKIEGGMIEFLVSLKKNM